MPRILCQLVPVSRYLVALTCIALAWLCPARGTACGATPATVTLLTDTMGKVPAGTKVLKLYVYGTTIEPTSTKVTVSMSAGGLPVTVPVTKRIAATWLLEVELSSAVQAGAKYTLTVSGITTSNGPLGPLTFVGGEATKVPGELGALMLAKRASGALGLDGCPAAKPPEGELALIKLAPSAAAEPWLRAVKHQFYVDGKAMFEPEVPLIDYVARKNEPVIRAYANCERATSAGETGSDPGIQLVLPAGEHSVKWTSTFPDGSTLETAPLAVDLRCAETVGVQMPPCCKPLVGSVDAGGSSSTGIGIHIGESDDFIPHGDASASTVADAGVDASGGFEIPASDDGAAPDGDGCSLGASSARRPLKLPLLSLAFVLSAFRRRRS